MRIGIIGTGAVGGYYGAMLVKQGFDVHFLLNSDYEHVKKHGLVIESKNGDLTLDRINAYSRAENMPACDIVIVALKTTQNSLLKVLLPNIVVENPIVVTLQNGYGIEEDIQKIVPTATVIGGLCFLCSYKAGPGRIKHLDYGSIRLGLYRTKNTPDTDTDILAGTADIFSRASIPIRLTEDLLRARWEKLVWNMGFNGTTVVLNATTHQLLNHHCSKALVKAVMTEVIHGARACGVDLGDDLPDNMLAATQQMVDYNPSMKHDYDSGRPLETETIYWRPIRAAEKYGCDMCYAKTLAYQLNFLEVVNRKN